MKINILERYARLPDGRYIIDINAGKVSDLYNDFDRQTPYVRKELDQDLVEYIIDSARDLVQVDFMLQFRLLEPPDDDLKARITASINSYFLYLKSLELQELGQAMRTSLIFFAVGVAFLFLSVWANDGLTPASFVVSKVFAQGLTVAAWVSMWEALATFLINWTPYSRQISLYERIAGTPVQFV